MFEAILTFLNTWNANKSERQKLQHAYLVGSAAVIMVAGITSLFNPDLGHDIVMLALIALGAFVVNAVCWNLLQSSLLDKLAAKPKRVVRK